MPYVHRNAMGEIESIHKSATSQAIEYLDPGDAEVRAFVAQIERGERFDALDTDVVRVLEDVVDAILAKGLIDLSDLPAEARAKLVERRERRLAAPAPKQPDFSASGFVEIIDDSAWGGLGGDVAKLPPR